MKTRFLIPLISLMCLTFLPLTLSAQMDVPIEETDFKTILIDIVLILLAADCAIKWIGFFRDGSDKQRQLFEEKHPSPIHTTYATVMDFQKLENDHRDLSKEVCKIQTEIAKVKESQNHLKQQNDKMETMLHTILRRLPPNGRKGE